MKKIFCLLISVILIGLVNGCTGYKPIFSSSNLQIEISEYSILGNKKLGNSIYSKLYNVTKSSKNDSQAKSINLQINTSKNKNSTAKNSAGKILEYKISLIVHVVIKDYLTDKEILNKQFISSSSYKVQDQHSETVKSENKIIQNILDKTFQDLLIIMSENILT